MFANGPEDLGSIPGRVIPKTQKMVLDASLLNTQHYKVRIKGKVEQSREGVAPSLHLGVVAIEKGAFGLPSTMVANFTLLTYIYTGHCIMVRVFANGPGDLGSIPGRVILKTQKMVLNAIFLNTQHYKVRLKWSNPGKGIVHSPTPWRSSN